MLADPNLADFDRHHLRRHIPKQRRMKLNPHARSRSGIRTSARRWWSAGARPSAWAARWSSCRSAEGARRPWRSPGAHALRAPFAVAGKRPRAHSRSGDGIPWAVGPERAGLVRTRRPRAVPPGLLDL